MSIESNTRCSRGSCIRSQTRTRDPMTGSYTRTNSAAAAASPVRTRAPRSGIGLASDTADIAGRLGQPNISQSTTWKVFADVKSIAADAISYWQLKGDQGTYSSGTHLGKLKANSIVFSAMTFGKGAGSIRTKSLDSSAGTTTGDIGVFIMLPVKPVPNPPVPQFSSGYVQARRIGLILVRDVDTTQTSGFKSAEILSYNRFAGKAEVVRLQGLTPGTYDQVGQYALDVTG